MRLQAKVLVIVCFMLAMPCIIPLRAADEEINNGQDFTRPVRRFDTLLRYDDMIGDASSEATHIARWSAFRVMARTGWYLSVPNFPIPGPRESTRIIPEGISEKWLRRSLYRGIVHCPDKGQMDVCSRGAIYTPVRIQERIGNRKGPARAVCGIQV